MTDPAAAPDPAAADRAAPDRARGGPDPGASPEAVAAVRVLLAEAGIPATDGEAAGLAAARAEMGRRAGTLWVPEADGCVPAGPLAATGGAA
jgi:hypothetical protein